MTAADPTPTGRLVLAATPIGDPLDAPARLAPAARRGRRGRGRGHPPAAPAGRRARASRRPAAWSSHHEHNEARVDAGARDDGAGGRDGRPGHRRRDAVGVRPRLPALAARWSTPACRSPTVPGPSAVLAALAVSGLPTDRFCFEGFLPRKGGQRARALAALADEPRTMVFFEAPHRCAADARRRWRRRSAQDRPAALCRELTKTYEEVVRGTLGELTDLGAGARGARRGQPRGRRAPTRPTSTREDLVDRGAQARCEAAASGSRTRAKAVRRRARRPGPWSVRRRGAARGLR